MTESSSTHSAPVRRLWMPVFIIALITALILYSFATEATLRYAVLYLGLAGQVLLVGIWWVFLAGKFRWKSLLIGVAAIAVLIFVVPATLRYEGSKGADPANFSWKWSPRKEALASLPQPPAAVPEIAPVSSDPDLADFPAFLGPNMSGSIPNPGLATDWEANPPEELWRIPVGMGWSAFSVVGERAVTQEQRGDEELVTCYHVKTGEFLWSHQDTVRFSEAMGGDGPRATPTIHDGVVYALGATGILNALKLEDGSPIWQRSVLEEIAAKNVEWGKSGSPLVTEDHVIVTGGDSETNAVIAYRRDNGEPAWKAGDGPSSYSSPVLLTLGGTEQIVAVLGDNVSGFEPATGKVLWRFDWPGSFPKVAQPIQTGPNQLLVASSYGIPTHLIEVQSGDRWTVTSLWEERQMKTKFSSPVVVEDYAYGLDEGKVICMEVATGDRIWKGSRFGYGQNLLVGQDLMLLQGERGDVALIRLNPNEFTELSRISPLSTKTWNAPALAGKYLLVRNDREAVCLKLP